MPLMTDGSPSALVFFSVSKMKLEMMDREKGLELFGKLIRTKKIENMQGDQPRSGPEPVHPVESKQKLQVSFVRLSLDLSWAY